MIIQLDALRAYEFSISGIRAIRQKTVYRQLQVNGRKLNGFICLLQGQCRFTSWSGSITVNPGDVVYLPYGSRHVFDILTEDTEFYRVDFHLTAKGDVVLFSETPILLCPSSPRECIEAIRQLATDYEFVQDSLAKVELMCRILRSLAATTATYEKKRLAPAIAYLSGHLTEKFSCRELARLCNLSNAQFYNIFKSEYAMTPLAYRNRLLLQRACMLLKDVTMTVTEIADALGFESVAYFSRFFKKQTGVSPSQYTHTQPPTSC